MPDSGERDRPANRRFNIDNPGLYMFLGGARSGKSTLAEKLACHLSGRLRLPVCYIATMAVIDDETEARVNEHRARRPAEWETVEEPYRVGTAIAERAARGACVFVVDCLTVFVSNWVLRFEQDQLSEQEMAAKTLEQVEELIQATSSSGCYVILVSNEVGMGVVPPYPLGRCFRDIAGWANQRVAAAAQAVYAVIAGIAVDVKELGLEF